MRRRTSSRTSMTDRTGRRSSKLTTTPTTPWASSSTRAPAAPPAGTDLHLHDPQAPPAGTDGGSTLARPRTHTRYYPHAPALYATTTYPHDHRVSARHRDRTHSGTHTWCLLSISPRSCSAARVVLMAAQHNRIKAQILVETTLPCDVMRAGTLCEIRSSCVAAQHAALVARCRPLRFYDVYFIFVSFLYFCVEHTLHSRVASL